MLFGGSVIDTLSSEQEVDLLQILERLSPSDRVTKLKEVFLLWSNLPTLGQPGPGNSRAIEKITKRVAALLSWLFHSLQNQVSDFAGERDQLKLSDQLWKEIEKQRARMAARLYSQIQPNGPETRNTWPFPNLLPVRKQLLKEMARGWSQAKDRADADSLFEALVIAYGQAPHSEYQELVVEAIKEHDQKVGDDRLIQTMRFLRKTSFSVDGLVETINTGWFRGHRSGRVLELAELLETFPDGGYPEEIRATDAAWAELAKVKELIRRCDQVGMALVHFLERLSSPRRYGWYVGFINHRDLQVTVIGTARGHIEPKIVKQRAWDFVKDQNWQSPDLNIRIEIEVLPAPVA